MPPPFCSAYLLQTCYSHPHLSACLSSLSSPLLNAPWYYCTEGKVHLENYLLELQVDLMKSFPHKVTESTELDFKKKKRPNILMKQSVTYFSCSFPEQSGSRFLAVPVSLSWLSPQSLVPWHGAYPLPSHMQKGRNQWLQCVLTKPCIIQSNFSQAHYFAIFRREWMIFTQVIHLN